MDGNLNESPLLIAQSGPLKGQRWTIDKTLMIGRESSCEIVVVDRMVSRFHARVSPVDKDILLEDLGSKNGTHCNGTPVKEKISLKDGDILQIALAQQFLFVTSDATMPLQESDGINGRLQLEEKSRRVWVDATLIDPPLSAMQFHILQILYEKQGQVVSRQRLVNEAWGEEQAIGVSDQALDALLRRLRERISEADPAHQYIITLRGHGIRLENPSRE
jgi:pSer/pThr/pTyr-binding forkhead associated (FHA) protein